MKTILGILFFIFSLSVTATETHLVCDGKMTTIVLGTKDKIAPDIDPITLTFDDKKKSLQSELLFPTCSGNQEQIESCKCTFEKTSISCKGLSRNKIDPKVIWSFNFGAFAEIVLNLFYDYICKLSPIKF